MGRGDRRSGNGDMGRVLRCFSSKILVVFRSSLNIVFRRDIMRIKKEERRSSYVGPRILRKLGLLWKSQGPLDLVVKVKPSPSRALSCTEFCCITFWVQIFCFFFERKNSEGRQKNLALLYSCEMYFSTSQRQN